ncbi:CRS2-associated factor 1 [Zostera marina]|uniref:CRS2-associated factor 1 n=1 Tax=Zostera marina TaxID=29655 RepID=A0A0K9PH34_ZOSMR|nr:CRS2-associated factor 1 [Zostera marina]
MFRHVKTLNLFFHLRRISTEPHSNLKRYNFLPPPTIAIAPSSLDRKVSTGRPEKRKHLKPRYRPPSSFDRDGEKVIHSDLPFEFRFRYTESNPGVKPSGLREPKYSPFGPGRVDRIWTGLSAPLSLILLGRGGLKSSNLGRTFLGNHFRKLRRRYWSIKRQINLGRDGFTHNMLIDIHDNWKHTEAVRIKCLGVSTVNMENICSQLEIILYRRRRYYPKKRPVIPLMLWKPREPIYPKLIKTTIDGLTFDETKELRRRGLAAPSLTKLGNVIN